MSRVRAELIDFLNSNPSEPLMLHIVGPSGTGKSYLAELLAKAVFRQVDCRPDEREDSYKVATFAGGAVTGATTGAAMGTLFGPLGATVGGSVPPYLSHRQLCLIDIFMGRNWPDLPRVPCV